MEAIEGPDEDRADSTGVGVSEHLVEHGSRLRRALDLLVGHRLEATRGGKLPKLGDLVLDRLLVGADPDVESGGGHRKRRRLDGFSSSSSSESSALSCSVSSSSSAALVLAVGVNPLLGRRRPLPDAFHSSSWRRA